MTSAVGGNYPPAVVSARIAWVLLWWPIRARKFVGEPVHFRIIDVQGHR